MKKGALLVILLLILPTVQAAKGLQITAYLDDIIYTGTTYTKLFKIKNLDHVSGKTDHINVTCGYNISNIKQEIFKLTNLNYYKTAKTGEFTPESAGDYTLCGWIINSTVDDTNKEDDLACKNITVLNQGQEPPQQKEESPPEQKPKKQTESEIEILNIDNEAKFGKTIDVKLRIYRGDTRKYAVYAEIENISKKTTMHFKDKFTNYTLTIPVQIKPNCNEKYPDGKYKLKVHGLGTSDSKKIIISGLKKSLCKTEKIVIEKNITVKTKCPNQTTHNIPNLDNIRCLYQSYKKPKIIYKSSSTKADNLTPIFIIAVLAILTIILIWRR